MIYKTSNKTLFGSKPLSIRCDDVNGSIKVYDGIRHLVLFSSERYDAIYNRIRYLLNQKIVLCFSHNNAKSKVDSFDSLALVQSKCVITPNKII